MMPKSERGSVGRKGWGRPSGSSRRTVVESKQFQSVFVMVGVRAGWSPWMKTVSGYFQSATMAGRAVIKGASGPGV